MRGVAAAGRRRCAGTRRSRSRSPRSRAPLHRARARRILSQRYRWRAEAKVPKPPSFVHRLLAGALGAPSPLASLNADGTTFDPLDPARQGRERILRTVLQPGAAPGDAYGALFGTHA